MTNGAASDQTPIDPKRVRAFAAFFKRYMSVSSLVVASLPIPVTSFNLIPTFSAQTKLLSVYTSLFCFLALGFIFYSRHQLARLMFPEYFGREKTPAVNTLSYTYGPEVTKEAVEEWFKKEEARREEELQTENTRRFVKTLWRRTIVLLPLIFIAASLVAIFQYNDVLILNVREIAFRSGDANSATRSFESILKETNLNDIKYSSRLMILYVAIFLTAEAAFIMMAIKEYLQDLVGLTEMDLIKGSRSEKYSELTPPREK
jgi:hypothetical protein